MGNKIDSLFKFFKEDLWEHNPPPRNFLVSFFYKILRIAISSAKGFDSDECYLKASALTFYSLLSIVPVLAVAFGIAKGFGFATRLEQEIVGQFKEQPEIANKIINFSYSMLSQTQGGLIAGIGIVVLLYTVIKLLENIESALNDIWKVPAPRSLKRKLSDYLAIMIICPIFFTLSSSTTIYIASQVINVTKSVSYLGVLTPWVSLSLYIIPYILSSLLLSFLYIIMPNTKVPWRYAIVAGIISGISYQIVQLIYIKFQIGVASYGAIYGSFAAIPLFLVWQNLSWQIALAGAEIAYHAEEDKSEYAGQDIGKNRKLISKKVVGTLIVGYCVEDFTNANSPTTLDSLISRVGAGEKIIRQVTEELTAARVLSEVKGPEDEECYQPARTVSDLSLKFVMDSLDQTKKIKTSVYMTPELQLIETAIKQFEDEVEKTTNNVSLDKLPLKKS